jgi:hypothetical protein
MEALSRETLENMMSKPLLRPPPSHSGRRVKPPSKNSDAVFTPEPRHTEHLSMIVRSPVFAPRKLPFMPPQNLTA